MTAINVPTLRAAVLLEKEKNTAVPTARTPERWRSRHAVADTAAVRSKTFPRATQPLVSDRNQLWLIVRCSGRVEPRVQ